MAGSSRMGVRSQLSRAVGRHRRLLAAGLAAAAMTAALTALRPEPVETAAVPVAARDLTAGASLRAADIASEPLPARLVPDGALAGPQDLVGQVLAGPVRRGEPFTDVRLVGTSAIDGYGEDRVGAPVRIADPGMAGLLRPGSVIDVLAVPTAGGLDATGPAEVVAAKVRVVSLPEQAESRGGNGTLVVVAATPRQAKSLTRSAAGSRLSVTLHGS